MKRKSLIIYLIALLVMGCSPKNGIIYKFERNKIKVKYLDNSGSKLELSKSKMFFQNVYIEDVSVLTVNSEGFSDLDDQEEFLKQGKLDNFKFPQEEFVDRLDISMVENINECDFVFNIFPIVSVNSFEYQIVEVLDKSKNEIWIVKFKMKSGEVVAQDILIVVE